MQDGVGRGERGTAPGPGGNPIADQLRPFEQDPLRFLARVSHEYGSVVRLHLWPQLFHLIGHPDGVRHVLTTHAANYHDPYASAGTRAGGAEGLFNSDDPITRRMARMAQLAFHRNRVPSFADAMANATRSMLDRWQNYARAGQTLDVEPELIALTLDILGRTLFNADLSDICSPLTISLGRTAPHHHVSLFQRLEQSPRRRSPDWQAAEGALDRFVAALIAERRGRGPADGDLLSLLIFGPDEQTGELLNDKQLWAMIMVLLVAGHAAIASALTWTLYLLGQHHDAARRVEAELDAMLRGRTPTAYDLQGLGYTQMVLQESMRLYPPLWMLAPRMARAEDTIAGFRIPAGSMILISPWVLHHDPRFWERPHEFDPERFAGVAPAAYLPFGTGPWGCLGSHFGLLEARLILAMVAQRYRWQLVPGYTAEPEPLTALRPRHGLPLILQQR